VSNLKGANTMFPDVTEHQAKEPRVSTLIALDDVSAMQEETHHNEAFMLSKLAC
jgi:isocitrate lyase